MAKITGQYCAKLIVARHHHFNLVTARYHCAKIVVATYHRFNWLLPGNVYARVATITGYQMQSLDILK